MTGITGVANALATDTHFSCFLSDLPSEVDVSSVSESTHVIVLEAVTRLEVELTMDSVPTT